MCDLQDQACRAAVAGREAGQTPYATELADAAAEVTLGEVQEPSEEEGAGAPPELPPRVDTFC